MRRALFAYGTLQVPEVLAALAGRAHTSRPARLEGFERLCVAGEVYPAIRPRPGARTEGRLYEALDPDVWPILDAFEGGAYVRQLVEVNAGAGESRVPAQAYVLRPGAGPPLEARRWCLATFRASHAAAYARSCARLRRALLER